MTYSSIKKKTGAPSVFVFDFDFHSVSIDR